MKPKEFVRLDMESLRNMAMTADHDITEQSADDRLVAYAAIAMKEKLRVARLKGRGGWWNPDECNIEQLRHMLQEHLEKGDVVDVMNFAAMIYARECADT